MNRRGVWVVLTLFAAVALIALIVEIRKPPRRAPRPSPLTRAELARKFLFDELQPVKLKNCELRRFGEKHDGGYLLCGNLLDGVESGYSYGISGYDGWGCDVSRTLRVPVHQYDCFDLTRPMCERGNTVFHEECVGSAAGVQEGRLFDTVEAHVAKNGDIGKRLLVKMDVEGAEWATFEATPDGILQRIDQLAVEFHGTDEQFIPAILKLKQFFHVAHLHWNNFSCTGDQEPFPALAYEVLFVNKRIGVLDPSARAAMPHVLDAPNNPAAPDCQSARTSGVRAPARGGNSNTRPRLDR